MRVQRPDSWRRDPRAGVLVVAFGLALVGFSALVTALIFYSPLAFADRRLSAMIREVDSPIADQVFRAISLAGDAIVVAILVLAVALMLIWRRRFVEAGLVVLTVAGGSIVGMILGDLLQRDRPSEEFAKIVVAGPYGLPSMHALSTLLLFGIVAFIVVFGARGMASRVGLGAACLSVPVLVGYSVVYLGVNWIGDVVAAWILAIAWMPLCVAGYFAFYSNGQKRRSVGDAKNPSGRGSAGSR
ncbi:MAG: phosphatase PAP2 family protein [Actinobacteria bacterium]|nr:phosphatase PAP2 family protein [Actinomycetota bacterium]MCL5887115.1 phosphatase PAP2 family protein [Actinomycetota bacterium]